MKKNKKVLLSTIALSSITASTLVFTSSHLNETQAIAQLTKNSRTISNNSEQKESLINPNELIYMSEQLNAETAPVFQNGVVIEENVTKWKNFSTNIKALQGYSSSSVAQELASIYEKVEKVVELNIAIQEIENLAQSNSLIASIKGQLINQLISESGVDPDLANVEGINNIPEKLLLLSGISTGEKISQISPLANQDAFFKTDLVKDPATASSSLTIGDIAGSGYKQLIKIAEIDPQENGNYALKFNKLANNQLVSGTIYIRNNAQQLTNSTPQDLANNFEIFGRWNTSNNNITVGDKGYDKLVENFIFQKNTSTNKYEVLVRVKENEIIQDIEFATNISGATNLKTPSSFGILDVQATNNTTFRSSILGESVSTLTNLSDSQNVVSSINFFSDTLTSLKDESATDFLNNRKMTFYQATTDANLSETSFQMWINTAEVSNTINYQKIDVYSNGQTTGETETIKIAFDGSKASTFEKNKYQLYTNLKDKLPQDVLDNFVEASKITLKSWYDSTSKFVKQELTFTDRFYALGDRKIGWTSVNVDAEKIGGILISDPTEKIFLEAPTLFTEPSTFETSSIEASEQVNERDAVISFLDEIYVEFSKPNGQFSSEIYNLGTTSVWTAENGKNIRTTTLNLDKKSPYDLYNELNSNWSLVSGLINKLFGESTSADRYNATQPNVVKNWLAKNTEYSSSKIESFVNKAIEIVKKDSNVNGEITPDLSFNSLTSESKKELANIVANLIKEQFTSIDNEFVSKQYNVIYNKLKEILSSTTTASYSVISDVSTILKLQQTSLGFELISYADNGWDNVVKTANVTLKDSVKSLLDLLYFENADGIKLGSSLFSTNDIKNEFDATNVDSLLNFEFDSIQSKKNKINIYGLIMSVITGKQEYDLIAMIDDMLSTGTMISQSKLESISSGLQESVSNIGNKRIANELNSVENKVESYYLDDLISGTNVIIALTWKKSSLQAMRYTNDEIIKRIDDILSNTQFQSSELSIWSELTRGTFNYQEYSEILSGRKGITAQEELAKKIIEDNIIMAARVEEKNTSDAILLAENVIKYAWWIILAAIGLGVFVSSTIGIATKTRQIKLSSRPVVKWLLISGIVLGLAVASLVILIGIGIL